MLCPHQHPRQRPQPQTAPAISLGPRGLPLTGLGVWVAPPAQRRLGVAGQEQRAAGLRLCPGVGAGSLRRGPCLSGASAAVRAASGPGLLRGGPAASSLVLEFPRKQRARRASAPLLSRGGLGELGRVPAPELWNVALGGRVLDSCLCEGDNGLYGSDPPTPHLARCGSGPGTSLCSSSPKKGGENVGTQSQVAQGQRS